MYLDNNATTVVLPEVRTLINDTLQKPCNANSPHRLGRHCRECLESARATLEDLLAADPGTLIFTSGATEANNLVLKGMLLPKLLQGQKPRLVTTVVEHSSILKTAAYLENLGVEVIRLGVDAQGQVRKSELESVLPADLVSIQWANSETGILQPIEELAAMCRACETMFHTDAAQAVGKAPLSLANDTIDFLSFTGHKFHAPPGIGALYARNRKALAPMLHGGDQEFGLRPGTENLAGIVGMAEALSIRYRNLEGNLTFMARLRDRLESNLRQSLPVRIIGESAPRTCNTTNILFPDIDGQALIARLGGLGVYCSQTSACIASRPQPSYVLRAMGLTEEQAWGCVRFSVSVLNTEAEIDRASEIIVDCYRKMKESP